MQLEPQVTEMLCREGWQFNSEKTGHPRDPCVASYLISLLCGVGPNIYNSTHKGSEKNVLAFGSKTQENPLEKLKTSPSEVVSPQGPAATLQHMLPAMTRVPTGQWASVSRVPWGMEERRWILYRLFSLKKTLY